MADIVVEDGDPSVTYFPSAEWKVLSGDYHDNSFHITWNKTDFATFSFTGASISYFADTNADHGDCSISIDGAVVQPALSTYSTDRQPVSSLFSQTLDAGPHTITITNLEDKAMGLDYFSYRSIVADLDAPTWQDKTVQANDAAVTYTPPDQWTSQWTPTPGYHLTYSQGASLSFAFEGEHVWFLSDRNNDHGAFEVSVDGGAASRFSSYSPTLQSVGILYSRALTPGRHTLEIRNLEDTKGLGAASFAYRPASGSSSSLLSSATTTLSTVSSSSAAPSSTSSPPAHTTQLPGGAIAGIFMGCAAVSVLALLLVIVLRGRRKQQTDARRDIAAEALPEIDPWVYGEAGHSAPSSNLAGASYSGLTTSQVPQSFIYPGTARPGVAGVAEPSDGGYNTQLPAYSESLDASYGSGPILQEASPFADPSALHEKR